MTIADVTNEYLAEYLKLDPSAPPPELDAIRAAASAYVSAFTGIPISGEPGDETINSHEDLWAAFMVVCQDMYDNRAYVTDGTAYTNPVADSIMSLRSRNLL